MVLICLYGDLIRSRRLISLVSPFKSYSNYQLVFLREKKTREKKSYAVDTWDIVPLKILA